MGRQAVKRLVRRTYSASPAAHGCIGLRTSVVYLAQSSTLNAGRGAGRGMSVVVQGSTRTRNPAAPTAAVATSNHVASPSLAQCTVPRASHAISFQRAPARSGAYVGRP